MWHAYIGGELVGISDDYAGTVEWLTLSVRNFPTTPVMIEYVPAT